ncbi:MAG: hypothetical protein RMX65_001010 [Nostoc sp. DedQUE01]|nr:hypothetical protein [Nostoc sp. DedQUE01]
MTTPKLMIEPSSWLETGIKLEKVNNLNIFKFTDELQSRSDELLEKSKLGLITAEEKAELDGISELAQIFTYANSVLASESTWSPIISEKSLQKEQNTSANIATPQNL